MNNARVRRQASFRRPVVKYTLTLRTCRLWKSIFYQPLSSYFTLTVKFTWGIPCCSIFLYISLKIEYIAGDNGAFYLLINFSWGAYYPKTLVVLEKDQSQVDPVNCIISKWLIIFRILSQVFPQFYRNKQMTLLAPWWSVHPITSAASNQMKQRSLETGRRAGMDKQSMWWETVLIVKRSHKNLSFVTIQPTDKQN